jgi:hypothetical protein
VVFRPRARPKDDGHAGFWQNIQHTTSSWPTKSSDFAAIGDFFLCKKTADSDGAGCSGGAQTVARPRLNELDVVIGTAMSVHVMLLVRKNWENGQGERLENMVCFGKGWA